MEECEDIEVVKQRISEALAKEEDLDPATVVAAMIELMVEHAVEATGGAVEALSMVLMAMSAAPVIADEAEGRNFYVN